MDFVLIESGQAPEYRNVDIGLSFVTVCSNSDCGTGQEYAIVNQGLGTFDFHRTFCALICPVCLNPIKNVEAIGFYKTSWEIKGSSHSYQSIYYKQNTKDYFIAFYPENFSGWRYATIITNSLDD
jgi:hypothetical protein